MCPLGKIRMGLIRIEMCATYHPGRDPYNSPFPQILYLNTNLSQTSPGHSRVDLVESIPNLQSSWIAQQFEIASLQSERHKSSS